jgi:hypothetical protein
MAAIVMHSTSTSWEAPGNWDAAAIEAWELLASVEKAEKKGPLQMDVV